MLKIYYISLFFTLLFTSCVQNEKLETRLNPIMKNDTLSNIPLHDAVRAKDINKVKEIVSDGFLLNTQDKAGFTALHLAVRFDQYDIAEYLIKKKVSVNTYDIYGDTPLLESMRNKTDNLSKLLLCNGANKDVKDRNLLSPLDYSKLDENLAMTKILEASDMKPFCEEKEIVIVQRVEEQPLKGIDTLNENTNVITLTVYDALKNEFNSDLARWNAEIKEGSLIFRFKNTDMLFAHGSSELSTNYKIILDDFFPRYLNVLYNYRDEIDLVRIEGHTSSVYSSAKNENEKYTKNKELSTKRANNVLEYVSSIKDNLTIEHKTWLNNYVKPYGMASDKLIYNKGIEDESLSRRVDFIIIKKK
ncbi:ankyrin repeat domain-containing protein [Arcobacter sp. s6]|uniref:ankyrin repeat domain-containing protein n=1 Tax=Arcobacter sp. s6 TaxID=3230363 RepID=UPI0034A02FFF